MYPTLVRPIHSTNPELDNIAFGLYFPDLLLVLVFVLEVPLVSRGLRLKVRLDAVEVFAVLVEGLEESRLWNIYLSTTT